MSPALQQAAHQIDKVSKKRVKKTITWAAVAFALVGLFGEDARLIARAFLRKHFDIAPTQQEILNDLLRRELLEKLPKPDGGTQ